jgi:hypothetical protein
MKKGSVILIPFPFTDLKGSKIRPAVVLSKSELSNIEIEELDKGLRKLFRL